MPFKRKRTYAMPTRARKRTRYRGPTRARKRTRKRRPMARRRRYRNRRKGRHLSIRKAPTLGSKIRRVRWVHEFKSFPIHNQIGSQSTGPFGMDFLSLPLFINASNIEDPLILSRTARQSAPNYWYSGQNACLPNLPVTYDEKSNIWQEGTIPSVLGTDANGAQYQGFLDFTQYTGTTDPKLYKAKGVDTFKTFYERYKVIKSNIKVEWVMPARTGTDSKRINCRIYRVSDFSDLPANYDALLQNFPSKKLYDDDSAKSTYTNTSSLRNRKVLGVKNTNNERSSTTLAINEDQYYRYWNEQPDPYVQTMKVKNLPPLRDYYYMIFFETNNRTMLKDSIVTPVRISVDYLIQLDNPRQFIDQPATPSQPSPDPPEP